MPCGWGRRCRRWASIYGGIGRQWNNGERFGRSFGYRRWLKAQEVQDPDRAMFGLGPCGEAAYRQYKQNKVQQENNNQQTEKDSNNQE